ncbi:hypothetical protein COCNU_01G001200 [Cocos nucifera]|uniref:Uncharacterized protein n=1 Tax=Cocos nucifera TaxID=13894 RepID=A0A8K0MTG4_COCNU|nr:hypothetical protein COCNU_01G001200 [Cocos nucifera]
MKFGASEAELPLEPVIEEAPIEGHELLPQKVSQGGGTQFDRVHDIPAQARPNSPSSPSSRKPRQRGMNFFRRRFRKKVERSLTASTTSMAQASRTPLEAHHQGSLDKGA